VRDRVTFIHTADLHLDAPFQGIGEASERVGRALAESTYEAFRRVVDVAIAREVDFVVIAGDAFNARDKSLRAQLRFREQMVRLAEAGIDVFVARGNHDPANGWSAGLALPANVHIFSADKVERFEVVADGEPIAAVYGRSFARASETANLSLGYRREASDAVTVGVLHANVGGNGEYDPYAPATLDDLRSGGMDYWALGHIHKQEVLARDPWVAYAGSPQGLNPKETGPHGCFVVQIAAGGTVSAEHVETAPIAWAQMALDASGVSDLDGARAMLVDACESLRTTEGRNVVARLALTGRCEAHADLVRPGVIDALLEDARAEAAGSDPWVWVDRIDDRTAAAIDLDAVRAGADFAAEALRIADELAADPAAVAVLLGEFAEPVATTLGGYSPAPDPSMAVERARDAVLDVLLGGEGR
jgi:DNA repair exonuclease SbcCD nuclease subunit